MDSALAQYLEKTATQAISALPKPRYLLVAGSPVGCSAAMLRVCAGLTQATIAVDAGANLLHAVGLPAGLLVGDLDSIDEAVLASLRAGTTEILAASPYKDQTDLELALYQAHARGAASIVVANSTGGRFDHQLAALGACLARIDQYTIMIVNDSEIVWLLPAGASLALGSIVQPGQVFSTLALYPATVLSESGCEWELNQATLALLDPRGTSNIVRSPAARIKVTSGVAAVVIPLES